MLKPITLPLLSVVLFLSSLALQADDPAPATKKKPAEAAAKKPAKETAKHTGLKTVKDKASYGFGLNVGRDIKQRISRIDLNLETFLEGFRASIKGEKSKLTQEELQKAFTAFSEEMRAKQERDDKARLDANKKYLADNAKKKGVTVTKSGLQYEVLKSGKGATPTIKDSVKAHYAGRLIDGTEFDSSYKRGAPTPFAVARVIPGWTEALQLMKVGDKWKLTIPANIAYGERPPQGSDIPPNSILIFEMELISIDEKK